MNIESFVPRGTVSNRIILRNDFVVLATTDWPTFRGILTCLGAFPALMLTILTFRHSFFSSVDSLEPTLCEEKWQIDNSPCPQGSSERFHKLLFTSRMLHEVYDTLPDLSLMLPSRELENRLVGLDLFQEPCQLLFWVNNVRFCFRNSKKRLKQEKLWSPRRVERGLCIISAKMEFRCFFHYFYEVLNVVSIEEILLN